MYRSDVNGENGCKNDQLPGYGTFCTNPRAFEYITWNPRLVFPKSTMNSVYTLPLNLTINKYSYVASVPISNNKTYLYTPVKPVYTKEWVSILAKNLGMSGDIRETKEAFYAGDNDTEQFLFVVQKNSSMILFWKYNTKSLAIQSDAQAITQANTFLQKNNLLPSDNLEPRVVNNTAVIFTRSGDRISEWKTNVVIYPQLINGLPVFNAQFNVEVDSNGNIIGFTRNWWEYSPYKEITLKSLEDAFSEFQTRSNQSLKGIPEKVNVTKVSLGYHMNQSGVSEYLEPVYIFEGYIQRRNSTEFFEPVIISANNESMQDALIFPTPSYKTEVMNKITNNFSAPVSNTITAQNTPG